jgi:hypothetical protein
LTRRAILAGLLLLCAGLACAQQPFATDDAEVTPRGQWHFEYANEFAVLQKSDYPNLGQDTSNFVIQYGPSKWKYLDPTRRITPTSAVTVHLDLGMKP